MVEVVKTPKYLEGSSLALFRTNQSGRMSDELLCLLC